MLRILVRVFGTLLLLLLIVIGVGVYLLEDANRFKPELVALIETQTGVPVRIDGDLTWQLLPPLSLSASAIRADHEGTRYQLDELALDVDLRSIVKTRDSDRWIIRSLRIDGLQMRSGEGAEMSTTKIEYLTLSDFSPGQPSPFTTQLSYQTGEQPAIPLTLSGLMTVSAAADTFTISDGNFTTTDASGVCNLTASSTGKSVTSAADGLIPLAVWQRYDWMGTCLLDRLTLQEEDFRRVSVELANTAGNSTTEISIPEFFGGQAKSRIQIDTRPTVIAWQVQPELQGVDSLALMTWLDQRLQWIAPLAYGGTITMQGNTEDELINSVRATTQFDGGQGQISIEKIKQPLLALAVLFEETDRIERWPDLWDYERMTGDWQVDGKKHTLKLALDNLTAAITGTYDPQADDLDMTINVIFEDQPGMHSFDVNPRLVDVPIPFRCRGTLDDPTCRIDSAESKRLVAKVLRDAASEELLTELDATIEEKVPEEFREVTRSLLDLLGGKKDRRKD